MERTFRLLRADEIEVRVGQTNKPDATRQWYTLLLYKDARCDMNILDETVGANNWSREHTVIKDVLYCTVRVRFPKTEAKIVGKNIDGTDNVIVESVYTDWNYKQDCGVPSFTEAEKGESSDSFKRACVNWGIGRELYTSPLIFINEPWKGVGDRRRLVVNAIEYDDNGSIKSVTIVDAKDSSFSKTFSGK